MESELPQRPLSVSRWIRLANFVIDQFGLMACFFVIGVVADLVGGPSAVRSLQKIHPILLGSISVVIYYSVLEGLFGRTLGKLVTGTCVVNEKGEQPQFRQIVGRSFSRIIPFEPFSVLLDDNGRGWHDSLPNTYVVKKTAVPLGESVILKDRIGQKGFTELMWFAAEGELTDVQRLLDFGAEVNAQDERGVTALMYAAHNGRLDIVQLLIAKGAQKTLKTRFGHTASDLAQRAGHSEIVRYLDQE